MWNNEEKRVLTLDPYEHGVLPQGQHNADAIKRLLCGMRLNTRMPTIQMFSRDGQCTQRQAHRFAARAPRHRRGGRCAAESLARADKKGEKGGTA